MATLEAINAGLENLNAMLTAQQASALTQEQVVKITEDVIQGLQNDPNEAFARTMRFTPDATTQKLKGSKYGRLGMTLADVEFMYDLQTSLRGKQTVDNTGVYQGPGEQLEAAFKEVSDAYYVDEETLRNFDSKRIDNLNQRMLDFGIHGFDVDAARKAHDTAESGYGSQLIGNQYVGDLWAAARVDSRIFGNIVTFNMTDPTAYLPVDADLPELLFVAESTANNSSNYSTTKSGSQRVQVDAKKFVLHQMWSGEMEEDSIIPFVPYLRRQSQLALAHYSDSLVLNGDTTNAGTGNINLDDADPADTKHYLAFDGIRHAGIVDNTSNAKSIAAGIVHDDFVDALSRMDDTANATTAHWGLPSNPGDVLIVMDPATYFTILKFDEFITLDKMGPRAVVLTGQVGSILGHPVIVSTAMSKTEADGKVSTTAANNTLGQVATFNRRGLRAGWRRRVRFETERLPATDQTRLVFSLRLGLGRWSPTGASSGIEWADIMYNITV